MIERVVAAIGRLAAWVFFLAAILAVVEVTLRYALHAPTIWTSELVIALCAAGYLLAGSEAERRGAHIRIGLFYDDAPAARRRLIDVVSVVVGLVFLAGLGWGAWNQLLDSAWRFDGDEWLLETTGRAWDVPLPPVIRAIFLAGVVLFALQLVARLFAPPARTGGEAH